MKILINEVLENFLKNKNNNNNNNNIKSILKEFDAERWGDSDIKKVDTNTLVDQLNLLIQSREIRDFNYNNKKKGNPEPKKTDVYIHSKDQHDFKNGKISYIHPTTASETVVTSSGDFDKVASIDNFIKFLTKKPETLISRNEKMIKSDGTMYDNDEDMTFYDIYYNTGIPAVSGLVYNETTKKFVTVSTCPGAGSCKLACYALTGSYIRFNGVAESLTARLNFLMNRPEEYAEMLFKELYKACKTHDAINKSSEKLDKAYNRIVFRWNDAGDFFSKEYYRIAVSVMQRLKKANCNIISTAYTKSGEIGISGGTKDTIDHIQFSRNTSHKREQDYFNNNKTDQSRVSITAADIKKNNVIDWFEKHNININNRRGVEEAKVMLFKNKDKFNLDIQNPEQIITYDELQRLPKKDVPYYYVLVRTEGEFKDGDAATVNRMVKGSILAFHGKRKAEDEIKSKKNNFKNKK